MNVTITPPPQRLGGPQKMQLELRDGEGLRGWIEVSKGGLVWMPPNARRGRRITWATIIKWMNEKKPPVKGA